VDWFLLNAGFDGSAQAASDFQLLLDNLLGNERFEVLRIKEDVPT